jgi:DNA-binding MarR family transcriptional regulator
MSTRKKQRRFREKPVDLTLDELGLLTHIRAHLICGKFQHTNKSTGLIFGVDESTISRIISRLEEKGKITMDRKQDSRGVWMTSIITPKSAHAAAHEARCACYQDLRAESGVSTCTGASHTTLQSSSTPTDLYSLIKRTESLHAPVHVALAAARQRLQKAKDSGARNFDRKQDNYHAREVHKALEEVRRLERLEHESGGAQ